MLLFEDAVGPFHAYTISKIRASNCSFDIFHKDRTFTNLTIEKQTTGGDKFMTEIVTPGPKFLIKSLARLSGIVYTKPNCLIPGCFDPPFSVLFHKPDTDRNGRMQTYETIEF